MLRPSHISLVVERLKRHQDPTSPFTILEPQNPWINEFYVVQKRRATDFKATKLWKDSSGSNNNSGFHWQANSNKEVCSCWWLLPQYLAAPNRPFHSFRVLKNVVRRFLCTSEMLMVDRWNLRNANVPSSGGLSCCTGRLLFSLQRSAFRHCITVHYKVSMRRSLAVIFFAYRVIFPSQPTLSQFKASKSIDRRILWSSGVSYDRFWSCKIVKGSVGLFKKRFGFDTELDSRGMYLFIFMLNSEMYFYFLSFLCVWFLLSLMKKNRVHLVWKKCCILSSKMQWMHDFCLTKVVLFPCRRPILRLGSFLSPEYVGVTVNLALLYCPVKLNYIVLPFFILFSSFYDSYSKDPRS